MKYSYLDAGNHFSIWEIADDLSEDRRIAKFIKNNKQVIHFKNAAFSKIANPFWSTQTTFYTDFDEVIGTLLINYI